MGRMQIRRRFQAEVLFVLMLLSLSGCVTGRKPHARKGTMDDVLVFRDLQQIDLNNDGIKDMVAIYATPDNASGVKVIKFHNSKGDVVFQRIFDTPDVRFVMKGNAPTLIVEQRAEAAGCTGGRTKDIYSWDGKAFTLTGKK